MKEKHTETVNQRLRDLGWKTACFSPNADTEKDEQRIYRGVFSRIPGKKILEFKENWEELLRKVLDMIEWVTQPTDETEPDLEFPIERYSAWDIETGDLLVLMRIPHKAKQTHGSDEDE